MAAAVFTLTVTGKRNLGGGALLAYGTFASDGGDYAAGGYAPTPTFESLDRISNRAPDIVLFQSFNGFKYEYNPTAKKIAIRVATTAGTNAVEAEHTAVAVVAGAQADVRWVAFWFPKVP